MLGFSTFSRLPSVRFSYIYVNTWYREKFSVRQLTIWGKCCCCFFFEKWRHVLWRVRFEYLFGNDCRRCYSGLVGSMGGLFFFIWLPVMGREIKWALKMSRSELSILPTTPRMQNNPFFCAWIIKRAPSERTRFGARNSKKHVTF